MNYTENYNLKKPAQGDFYDVNDFNGNVDIIDAELKAREGDTVAHETSIAGLEAPVFDDTGTVTGISSFPDFMETVKSKMNIFQFYRNLKAGLQFVLHAGQVVNNCVTDRGDLPGSAKQLKVLMDLYTVLNTKQSDFLQFKPAPLYTDLLTERGIYYFQTTPKTNTTRYFPVVGSVGDSWNVIKFRNGDNGACLFVQQNWTNVAIGTYDLSKGYTLWKMII